jgi:hypothetical protein
VNSIQSAQPPGVAPDGRGSGGAGAAPPPEPPVPSTHAALAEVGGRDGPDPTRYGDWELRGRCIDF